MTLSRRRFLAGAGAACAGGLVTPLLRPQLALAADGQAAHTLVLVVLDGGLDGISALVPAGDPAYGRCRKATRVPGGIAVAPGFALHPALAPIADLWTDGVVAAIPAVGTASQSRSHFAERSVVAMGTGGGSSDGSGWLTRHLLTRSGGAAVTLQGVSVGSLPALELAGHAGAFHVPDLAATGIAGWDPARLPAAEAALSAAYAAAPPDIAGPAAVAFDALARIRSAGAGTLASTTGYADDRWSRELRQVAQLIRADIGVEAAVVSFGGWDTHRDQGGPRGHLATQLERLGRGLASFTGDLADRLDRLTVVVVSEFGRRVIENGSGGTDHGRGGLAFVLGGGVKGGVHGPWPGLDDATLVEGDLPVATDVRSVLAEVVRHRLGNPALDQVLPGFTPVPVGFAGP